MDTVAVDLALGEVFSLLVRSGPVFGLSRPLPGHRSSLIDPCSSPRADYLPHMSVPLQVASGNYLCGTVFVALVTSTLAREKAEAALQNLFHRPQVKQ